MAATSQRPSTERVRQINTSLGGPARLRWIAAVPAFIPPFVIQKYYPEEITVSKDKQELY